MPKEKKFYVYVHRYASGPKEGQVFYVGKGKGNRLSCIYKRSKKWNNVVNKYGFTYEVFMRFDNEVCAFSFEKSLIRFYGRENLVNLTDGGEGLSGFSPSNETRIKMSLSRKGKKHSDKTKKKMSEYMSKNHPMKGRRHSPHTIKKLCGKPHYKHPLFDDEERCFIHEDGSIFVGTRYDFNNSVNADPSSTAKLICGKINHHKKWRLPDEDVVFKW